MSQAYRQVKGNRSRAARAGVVNTLTTAEWRAILDAAAGVCAHCWAAVGRRQLTMDHVIPLAYGGPHAVGNVWPVCCSCNQARNRLSGHVLAG